MSDRFILWNTKPEVNRQWGLFSHETFEKAEVALNRVKEDPRYVRDVPWLKIKRIDRWH